MWVAPSPCHCIQDTRRNQLSWNIHLSLFSVHEHSAPSCLAVPKPCLLFHERRLCFLELWTQTNLLWLGHWLINSQSSELHIYLFGWSHILWCFHSVLNKHILRIHQRSSLSCLHKHPTVSTLLLRTECHSLLPLPQSSSKVPHLLLLTDWSKVSEFHWRVS